MKQGDDMGIGVLFFVPTTKTIFAAILLMSVSSGRLKKKITKQA
jgi:hypothetical protein